MRDPRHSEWCGVSGAVWVVWCGWPCLRSVLNLSYLQANCVFHITIKRELDDYFVLELFCVAEPVTSRQWVAWHRREWQSVCGCVGPVS